MLFRSAIYVDRNGILVWGGIIWARTYNSSSQTLSLSAREMISYFERRRIIELTDFVNTDQLVIAKTLIENAQAQPYGDINILYNSEGQTTSGVLVDRVYYSYELKTVFNAIQDLSRQNDGFDFHIDVEYDNVTGQPTASFNTYYPQVGTPYNPADPYALTFIFPAGNIVEYEYPEDGTIAVNSLYALGAGSNEGKQIANAQNMAYLGNGWALLEDQAN